MEVPPRPPLRLIRGGQDADLDGPDVRFRSRVHRAMARIAVVMQPIVWADRDVVFGHEALVRSRDPWLRGPLELFTAAEEADEVLALEDRIRRSVAALLDSVSPDEPVFVNVHPAVLDDPRLLDADAPLSRYAERVIIEISERAPLSSVEHLPDRLAALRGLGYRIAIDDLGADYRGLCAFAEANPDVVKFDMALVRDIDANPVHAELLASMIAMARDLKILTVAVGVQTEEERQRLTALGCDLLQGFRFARPHWPVTDIAW